ncbi:butyrophilin-like protein 1 isoform X1 [Epinephelus fuscoguttatus]|uniref:butyrophilin-like protein 1 isoform X1 n=1 Tax=Epinephelus fuscoguttatus TaxID=293821 RepID=UPI0020D1BEB2|nr:butyrophilin-like protein 1 isoform X1 [Epinephelus fuscoguttatus]
MNMASMGILLIFALICVSINADTDFVKVECKAQQTGQCGQHSLLECVVRTTADVVNAKIIVVTWRKKGDSKPLMVYNRELKQLRPGYKFAEPSWNVQNMNVSLLITNTALKDSGNYSCYVMTDSGDHTADISLDVTAKYNQPKIYYDPGTTGGTLMCESDGGFPKGRIGWFSELKDEWTSSSQMEAKKTGSGLFHLSSKLPLQPGSRFSNYTCIVYNASGGKEGENTFVLPDLPPERQETGQGPEKVGPAAKIVAPVVVIGSLIVGLLLVLVVLHRRRLQQARRCSTTPLMSGHHQVPDCGSHVEEGDLQEIGEKWHGP